MVVNKLLVTICLLLSVIFNINCNKSVEKCKEYSKLFKNYKNPTFTIDVRHGSEPISNELGKVPAQYGEFPHMVRFLYDYDTKPCGGLLISDRYALSTYTCKGDVNLTHIVLGDHNISSDLDNEHVQKIKIKNIISHPNYKTPIHYNDIILIELSESVRFNEYVRPACLYSKQDIPSDVQFSATGWGPLSFEGEIPGILHKVYLDIFSNEECNSVYSKSRRRLPDGIDEESMVCAGGKTTPKGVCNGDTGGPLQFYNSDLNMYEAIGLVSFGKACGIVGVPGVYTRISKFLPWIESIVWNE